MPSSMSFKSTYSPAQISETLSQRLLQRIPPFALRERTANGPGDSSGGLRIRTGGQVGVPCQGHTATIHSEGETS